MDFDWQTLWNRYIGDATNKYGLKKLEDFSFQQSQAIWALIQYKKATVFPNPSDFIVWFGNTEETLPSPLVAAGLISDDSVVVDLARKLQTLEAAWFPTEVTKLEMDDLERKLKAAL